MRLGVPVLVIVFDRMPKAEANDTLTAWDCHWLGPCRRPFGVQAFGLWLDGELLAVAISASTVNASRGGYKRGEVVELARLTSHPDHTDMTRVALRLWRKVAAREWAKYWPVKAYVSYANAARHKGDIYRFDGWKKVADVRGGRAGTNTGWTRPRKDYEAKAVWVWEMSA